MEGLRTLGRLLEVTLLAVTWSVKMRRRIEREREREKLDEGEGRDGDVREAWEEGARWIVGRGRGAT